MQQSLLSTSALWRKYLRTSLCKRLTALNFLLLTGFSAQEAQAQTLAFPGAMGFGRHALGARGVAQASRQVYIVTNLNDSGAGSFRDAVSQPGRIVTFAVGGIINITSSLQVAANTTIAGQTAPGTGIVIKGAKVTFTGSNNTIARFLRIRYGGTSQEVDASGMANGANVIFDHMSFSWGTDEVFSINSDGNGTPLDNITLQNCIIAQGIHRHNHSASGLIQPPNGGKVSLIQNLYISNKTRNPKVKGVNEFVNNVVYDWGNGNRLADNLNYGWSGEAYIMGGDSGGESYVNIINNYFVGGPLTNPSTSTPFSRGNSNFYLYGSGNYFDNNQNGVLDGSEVPYNTTGYPTGDATSFQSNPYDYPNKAPKYTAAEAYQHVIDSVGSFYPRRDQVDSLLVSEVESRGTKGFYVYIPSNLPFSNGGAGNVYNAPAPTDTDSDGMPDTWETANGLNKDSGADATAMSTAYPQYMNIEVYVNSLISTPPLPFVKAATNLNLTATTSDDTSNSKIVLTWVDNADNETGYILERSTNGTTYTEVGQLPVDTKTYTDENLSPSTLYYYRIKAVTATEASVYTISSVTTPGLTVIPNAPTTPSPANSNQSAEVTLGKVTLGWAGSSNTVTYSVYFGSSADALTKVADVPYSASPGYQVTGINNSTTYYWRVDATNIKGTTTGTVWSFKTSSMVSALVGYWRMDESSGLVAADASGLGSNGALTGMSNAAWSGGKYSGALGFGTPANNGGVIVADAEHLRMDQNSFSISMWVKMPSNTYTFSNAKDCYLIQKGTFEATTGKWFGLQLKDGKLTFAIDDGVNKTNLDITATTSPNIFNNEWKHIVAIRDITAKVIKVYIDNVQVGSKTYTTNSIGKSDALMIGNSTENKPYRDLMDDVRLYNYALSTSEIASLYNGSDPTLPVTLETFSAKADGYGAKIEWSTSSERNNDRFIIEHSVDGVAFNVLQSVKGKGNSSLSNVYTIFDSKPVTGINYYKLKQVDHNGDVKQLGVKAINISLSRQTLEVYPNPASQEIHVKLPSATNSNLSVTISSIDGKIIHRESFTKKASESIYTIRFKDKPATGQYVLKLMGQGISESALVLIE